MTRTTTHEGGRFFVAFPRRFWYPVAASDELGRRRPFATALFGTPLVVFRDGSGAARVLVDRCPHRNAPLSLGRVTPDGNLECAYHGWRFAGDGTCRSVPGLTTGIGSGRTRAAAAYTTRERDGFVWVWADPAVPPSGEPFGLPALSGAGCGRVVFRYDLEATLHAALENALDVPHTAFLHRGIFRGGEPREITATRREIPGGVEVRYEGEPVGLGRFRGREGSARTFDHWDRFFLPSIAQVEYRVEGWLRIVNTILHLPMEPFCTRAWFVVQYWSRLPARLVAPLVWARGRQILGQDARMLAAQAATIRRFGGERFTSTPLDVMGGAVWRLLREAERAEQAERDGTAPAEEEGAEAVERTVSFRI